MHQHPRLRFKLVRHNRLLAHLLRVGRGAIARTEGDLEMPCFVRNESLRLCACVYRFKVEPRAKRTWLHPLHCRGLVLESCSVFSHNVKHPTLAKRAHILALPLEGNLRIS